MVVVMMMMMMMMTLRIPLKMMTIANPCFSIDLRLGYRFKMLTPSACTRGDYRPQTCSNRQWLWYDAACHLTFVFYSHFGIHNSCLLLQIVASHNVFI